MLDRPAELRKLMRGSVQPWLGAVASYIRSGKERGIHYADVDEEAYVVHILLLVITATASASVALAALNRDARPRYDRELARIARSSLFPPPAVAGDRHVAPAVAGDRHVAPAVAGDRKRKASR